MWIGGAYGLCHMKNQCKDQVFRYDALALEECLVLTIICSVSMGYMEQVTMIPVTLYSVPSIMKEAT